MINIRGVSLVYNQGKQNEFCALKNINLDVNNGELVIAEVVKAPYSRSSPYFKSQLAERF